MTIPAWLFFLMAAGDVVAIAIVLGVWFLWDKGSM